MGHIFGSSRDIPSCGDVVDAVQSHHRRLPDVRAIRPPRQQLVTVVFIPACWPPQPLIRPRPALLAADMTHRPLLAPKPSLAAAAAAPKTKAQLMMRGQLFSPAAPPPPNLDLTLRISSPNQTRLAASAARDVLPLFSASLKAIGPGLAARRHPAGPALAHRKHQTCPAGTARGTVGGAGAVRAEHPLFFANGSLFQPPFPSVSDSLKSQVARLQGRSVKPFCPNPVNTLHPHRLPILDQLATSPTRDTRAAPALPGTEGALVQRPGTSSLSSSGDRRDHAAEQLDLMQAVGFPLVLLQPICTSLTLFTSPAGPWPHQCPAVARKPHL